MINMSKKTLEEIARNVRKGIKLPKFEPLNDFETKIKKIARAFGGNDTIHQEGSHKIINIGNKRIGWSPRQKGNEDVLSSGVFERAVKNISKATSVPYDQLELYFKGSGKPYRKYKRNFEEKYSL